MKRIVIFILLILLVSSHLEAQKPNQLNSGEIYHAIEKLNFLGTALYLAAHPDDENTRMISYLSNEVKANTAYLSLTRGDGGQNLIGLEIQELLGVLRTQELLEARKIDGGKQFFTRANDFGYSKHPDETLRIWNKEEVLKDVVWIIRNFKPDVVINRFDHRRAGRTHGHHTSSALLSIEAFDLTNDSTVYPEQLKHTEPWQVNKLYYNTSWWRYGSREKFAEVDKSKMARVDIGVYYPVLGKSNSEIASEARSMHKCQGMGNTGSRGSSTEFLEIVKGVAPVDNENIFDGINTTWTRVQGGKAIQMKMDALIADYDYLAPQKSVKQLVEIRSLIRGIDNDYWKNIKLSEVDRIIESCLGLYAEVYADAQTLTPTDVTDLTIECTNRSNVPVTIRSIRIPTAQMEKTVNESLEDNAQMKWFETMTVPNLRTSEPYWINDKAEFGMYNVDDPLKIGMAETPRELKAEFELDIYGETVVLQKDIIHKYTDRVAGEVIEPVEIVNPVSVRIENGSYFFSTNDKQVVKAYVKAGKENVTGTVRLQTMGTGWQISPASHNFNIAQKGDEASFEFTVVPPQAQSIAEIAVSADIAGNPSIHTESIVIDYDHITKQTVNVPAKSKIVKIELETAAENIGYIDGAGDKVAESLRLVGYNVTNLPIETLNAEALKGYDAIMIGIRALNTKKELKFKMKELLKYVENGGNLVIQYNTTRGLNIDEFAPYPLKLSRDRVSDENAEVRILAPEHQVLHYPNKISSKDFDGWIQERGLYFPNEWDSKYTAILSMNDVNEDPKDGSLLIAPHGSGYFVYTGISWFRELPAGVPGAFRLLSNILALKQNKA